MAPKKQTMDARMDADVKEINAKAKETEFLSTGVVNMDGTFDEDYFPVSYDDLHKAAQRITEKNPSLSFMLIACGSANGKQHNLVYAHSVNPRLDKNLWLQACGFPEPDMPYPCESPIKEKDLIISKSCNYLRQLGLIHDEDEEAIPFDINAD
jgi:hypothetical protein